LVRRIEEWLGNLGLGECASRFVENDLDFEILGDLTEQDLEKIGVASVGHRRKLLRAISELNASRAETVSVEEAPTLSPPERRTAPGEPEPSAVRDVAGEPRYLTVLFCDLVDSTGIASRLDAEEWRDLVGAYFEAASAAVTERGGTVAKKLGDGLMALLSIAPIFSAYCVAANWHTSVRSSPTSWGFPTSRRFPGNVSRAFIAGPSISPAAGSQ
jgi:hypothetical protein